MISIFESVNCLNCFSFQKNAPLSEWNWIGLGLIVVGCFALIVFYYSLKKLVKNILNKFEYKPSRRYKIIYYSFGIVISMMYIIFYAVKYMHVNWEEWTSGHFALDGSFIVSSVSTILIFLSVFWIMKLFKIFMDDKQKS